MTTGSKILVAAILAVQLLTLIGLGWISREFLKLRDLAADVSEEASSQTAGTRSQILARLQDLDEALVGTSNGMAALGSKVDEQSMLVGRALGKVIPYKLPDDAEARMAAVESELKTAVTTAPERARVEAMRAELAGIVERLPPWAQEELLPRFVPMRWELEGLWVLSSPLDADLGGLVEENAALDVLLSNRPLGTSDELAQALESRRQQTVEKISTAERTNAIEAGKRALTDKKDMESAVRLLTQYDDEETKSLVANLTEAMLRRSIRRDIQALTADIKTFKDISDPELREYGFQRAKMATMDIRLRTHTLGVSSTELEQALTTVESSLSKGISATTAQRRSQYQVWALNQIKQVQTLDQIEDSVFDKNAARETLRNEMVAFLGPIDEAYLDVAVRSWYGKVYAARFAELKDLTYQLSLVEGFASTAKKLPEDIL